MCVFNTFILTKPDPTISKPNWTESEKLNIRTISYTSQIRNKFA